MADALGLILEHLERLLSYPDWLPIEKYEILFYRDELKVRRDLCPWNTEKAWKENMKIPCQLKLEDIFRLANGRHLVAQKVDSIGVLVANVLEQKNETNIRQDLHFCGRPNLIIDLGEMVRGALSVLYDMHLILYDDRNKFEPYFYSGLYFDAENFQAYNSNGEGEICVGFDGEERVLLEKLTTILKQLEVISIVGMCGLGKTTLARKVYEHPLIVYQFYIRAWVSVSQVYNLRDILLGILSSVIELTDELCRMSAYKLGEELYRRLKGKRYLIVVDDVWNIGAWDAIKRYFPNDNNGSRIMLTTRLGDVALHAQSDKNPHLLHFLTEDESWDLFQKKVFLSGSCFSTILMDIGREITRKCQGLPLAIVVIAGLLRNNFEIGCWEQVARSVSSYVVSDPKQYMDTLALSYNNLPNHLKPCFLYLGVFPEDYEIPVRKLIWLWIAEGFICQIGGKSLEDVARDYLMDLLKRSLIVVAKKGSNGGVKTFRIHDLLRELCLRKAEEENFSPKSYRYMKQLYYCAHRFSSSSSSHPLAKSSASPVSSVSCVVFKLFQSILKDKSRIWEGSKLLRALDLSCVQQCIFPSVLLQLVHLRYLELKFTYGSPPESICNLTDLETLIISSKSNIIVPENIWKMVNMRHLCITSGENLVKYSCFEEPKKLLENIQTISQVSPSRSCEHILAKTPNLRKLGLCGPLLTQLGDYKFPDLSLLNNLEALKLLNTTPISGPGGARPYNTIMFPGRLKRLTISSTNLEWKDTWIFEMLPNLEVLKLKINAFVGKVWETSGGVFCRLKFLKFEGLDILNWRATCNHFPILQRLVVHQCPNLKEIPPDFGNISTLEWIEISGCNETAINSAREIQREELDNGNNFLKILINPMANSF